jgi:aldose 1-epimerase
MTVMICLLLIALLVSAAVGTQGSRAQPSNSSRSVLAQPFGTTDTDQLVKVYTLANANGVELRAMNYGGIILSLRVPDRDGRFDDIVLGYESLDEYLEESPYFGAIVGRYANRIAGGRFTLNGKTYKLATNNGPNHLHGGTVGFDQRVWDAAPFVDAHGTGITFSYTSPAGEEGYPGTLETTVRYTLTDDNQLIVYYEATATEATPVNLSQHTYFNLAGDGRRDILDHRLMLNANYFTPVDSTLIPTGELHPVAGTPFDFTSLTPIGARIDADDTQVEYGQGYDHNFVLDRSDAGKDSLALAARVVEPQTGRVLTVHTTEPGVQFYTGNFLDGSLTGKDGAVYERRYGFCLETQHFPDSPNQPNFPSTILHPGETYRSRTIFTFSTQAQ